jgi:hypothetical protein
MISPNPRGSWYSFFDAGQPLGSPINKSEAKKTGKVTVHGRVTVHREKK